MNKERHSFFVEKQTQTKFCERKDKSIIDSVVVWLINNIFKCETEMCVFVHIDTKKILRNILGQNAKKYFLLVSSENENLIYRESIEDCF